MCYDYRLNNYGFYVCYICFRFTNNINSICNRKECLVEYARIINQQETEEKRK